MGDLVSITVTTKNEEKNILNCIRSIQLQTWKDIEIIVIDNNSSDKTREIAGEYTDKVFILGPERSAQRNYGMIERSSGKYVMYIDADMILSPLLIENCVLTLEKYPYPALHIPEIVLGSSFWSKVRRFERGFYNGTSIDGARIFRRDAFVRTGGFDLSMSGPEDWDMDKMIQKDGKIGLVENLSSDRMDKDWGMGDFIASNGVNPFRYRSVIFHNESEFNLKKYLGKKGYYAQSFETYIRKWGKKDPDIRRQFGFFYRFIGVFFEKGKFLKILAHPILFASMILLRFLVGATYLLQIFPVQSRNGGK